MAQNTLVINCDIRETRVALIEGGVIAELFIERAAARGTVGNIVLGRVTRVLPGMQAAFIDVGMERAAFLHVEDLIRPKDFEAYLHGDARDADEPSMRGEGGRRRNWRLEPDEDDDDEHAGSHAEHAEAQDGHAEHAEAQDGHDEHDEHAEAQDGHDEHDESHDSDEGAREPAEAAAAHDDAHDDAPDEAPADDSLDDAESEAGPDDEPAAASDAEPEAAQADAADVTGEAGELQRTARDANAPAEGAESRRRRRGRRKRGKGAAAERADDRAPAKPHADRANDRSNGGKGNGKAAQPATSRVSRSVPITEVVKEGDEVIVQISKEPIGTKGARVTSHVSLPGRYVVYLPTVDHAGISKRIGSSRERQRLRAVMDTLKPPVGGLIVRTVAEGLTKGALKADVGYLMRLWAEVARKREGAKAPTILSSELDLVLKTARDLFTDDIHKIVIDDKDQYARLVRFVEMFLPERVKDIELYTGAEPIFDAYGIEDEIGRALGRKVPLASGGYLIIDQAEALTAVDVNTGRYVGKGSKDLEETALKTNLEAVQEIAYQLRFRNIGGLVILDLIDMENANNREKVWRALVQRLSKDKAKTTLNRISELGLIEMTRKRTRESLMRVMHEPCFYCDGTGQIQSRTTIAYEILRQIRRERQSLPGYVVLVNAHPAVVDLMNGEEKDAVVEAERRYMRRIELVPRREYHIEQFDLQGK
ncbi:MAG: Rne/Rng family ribonuclease [Sorangiineae bacterium]|nr:Rne/Rng family ribonuclease [Polyangiaceae bacterium]MEB2321765.1 Rne/Rng family ribonuclease [Sorangiineae bacterium]